MTVGIGRHQRASYRGLLKEKTFRRFFIAQSVSSLGDWIGLIAILALVKRLTNDPFAVAAMLLARLAPALFIGPIAGVIVDRWNRKYVMIACDVARGFLILTLPYVGSVSRAVPLLSPVVLLFLISALLEMFSLLWQPAKDSTVPLMVPSVQLPLANSMVLMGAYGTFPVSGAAFSTLAGASKWLGHHIWFFSRFASNPEHPAFFFDSLTFLISALIVATLLIPRTATSKKRLNFRQVWVDFVEGLRIIRRHPMVRPWVFAIGMIFVGVGSFLSIAVFYVNEVLRAGSAGFGLLVTGVGLGLGVGLVFAGIVSRFVPKDLFFSISVMAMGFMLIVFGSVSTLAAGAIVGGGLGLFAGFSYPSGLTLMQENVSDEYRGRTLASMHSVVRLALVGSLAAAPALAKLFGATIGRHLVVFNHVLDLPGARVVLWLGGLSVVGAGVVSTRAVRARLRSFLMPTSGIFLVFEGGEGTGKSTQMARLADFLESRGHQVLVTREPGGTAIGHRIREILLDPSNSSIDPKTEALLYAADRAQHVQEVIRPALQAGKIVISDRYVDSSLAYQGLGRSLGVEEVLDVSRWATGALMPDLVFLLDFDPGKGLERAGVTDRIEAEPLAFHEEVREAYKVISSRFPERFVVIDASAGLEEVEQQVRARVIPYLERANLPVGSRTAR